MELLDLIVVLLLLQNVSLYKFLVVLSMMFNVLFQLVLFLQGQTNISAGFLKILDLLLQEWRQSVDEIVLKLIALFLVNISYLL